MRTSPRSASRRLGIALAALTTLWCAVASAETLPTAPKGKTRRVEAGPIFDNAEAQTRCPAVCAPPSQWKGGWRTIKGATMSECDCVDPVPVPAPPPPVRKVKAGFVKDTRRARVVCPRLCKAPASWSGSWRTTVKNKMSECDCLDPAPAMTPAPPAPTVRELSAGAIWSNDEAKQICPKVCAAPLTWKGVWRTTKVQTESVCACEEPTPPTPPTPAAPRPAASTHP